MGSVEARGEVKEFSSFESSLVLPPLSPRSDWWHHSSDGVGGNVAVLSKHDHYCLPTAVVASKTRVPSLSVFNGDDDGCEGCASFRWTTLAKLKEEELQARGLCRLCVTVFEEGRNSLRTGNVGRCKGISKTWQREESKPTGQVAAASCRSVACLIVCDDEDKVREESGFGFFSVLVESAVNWLILPVTYACLKD